MSKNNLHIGFLLGSPDISGGTYVIYEHGSRLVDMGHDVKMLTREPVSPDRHQWHPRAEKLGWLSFGRGTKTKL